MSRCSYERQPAAHSVHQAAGPRGRLGRANRRAELEAKIEKATADLAANKPAKVANSDAKALAAYLSGLGFDVDADRINKWLVLLAVLIVECGAGVSIVVGTTLAAKPAALRTGRTPRRPDHPLSPNSLKTPPADALNATATTRYDAASGASFSRSCQPDRLSVVQRV